MWFLAVYGGLTLILIVFCLPETLARRVARRPPPPGDGRRRRPDPRVDLRRSAATTTKQAGQHFKRFVIDPLEVLLYLRFMPILITVYSAAIAFGALFVK